MPIFPWAAAAWRAWNDLMGDRSYAPDGIMVGMGAGRIAARPQPIWYPSLVAWCVFERLPDHEARFVMACVRALDGYYLTRMNEKITDDMKKLLKA